jgi:hypothetical protein
MLKLAEQRNQLTIRKEFKSLEVNIEIIISEMQELYVENL